MEALFLKVLNMSLAASGFLLAAMALRLVLRRAPRRLLCLLWALAAARLLCPVSLTNPWSLAPSAQTIPADIAQAQPPQIHSGVHLLNSAVNPALAQALPAEQEPAQPETPAHQTADRKTEKGGEAGWLTALARLWLVGAALTAGGALLSTWRLRRRMAEACRAEDGVYRSERADSPFVLGLIRPRIYLPASLPPEAADYVIAHERSHIRRGDHWAKALGRLAVSVHWFNPLVWAAYLLLCRDLELACDESVIRRLDRGQVAEYAQTLLNCSLPRPVPGPLAFGRLGVKTRVQHILHYRKPAFWLAPITILACGLASFFWMTDPGQGPELPAESTVLSLSIRQGQGATRQTQDREQIQAVLSALGQAKPSGRNPGQAAYTLWLDDGGPETRSWQLDEEGLLKGPEGVYRLTEEQKGAVEAAWQAAEAEPVYTLARLEYGQVQGERLTLEGDRADLARQCILQSRALSAAFPGQPPEQLAQCWRLQAGQGGGQTEYYVYLQEGRPVFQAGDRYTMMNETLYQSLTGQTPDLAAQSQDSPPQLLAPVQGEISNGFGARVNPISGQQKRHEGIDFAAANGDPVVASADGQVVQAGWDETYGYCLLLDHGGGWQTFYGNNSQLLAEEGRQVSQGQQIAKAGSTGASTGPHCHWEARLNGQPVDPTDLLTYAVEPPAEQPADPMTWQYRPAISSVFPAMPIEIDLDTLEAKTEEKTWIQVSCDSGTFFRHDESQSPNYQNMGQSCRYSLGERVFWSPGLPGAQQAAISFRAETEGQSAALMEGQIAAQLQQPDSLLYNLSLASDQPLTMGWDQQRDCFVVKR